MPVHLASKAIPDFWSFPKLSSCLSNGVLVGLIILGVTMLPGCCTPSAIDHGVDNSKFVFVVLPGFDSNDGHASLRCRIANIGDKPEYIVDSALFIWKIDADDVLPAIGIDDGPPLALNRVIPLEPTIASLVGPGISDFEPYLYYERGISIDIRRPRTSHGKPIEISVTACFDILANVATDTRTSHIEMTTKIMLPE